MNENVHGLGKKIGMKILASWVAERAMKGGKLAKEPIITKLNNRISLAPARNLCTFIFSSYFTAIFFFFP